MSQTNPEETAHWRHLLEVEREDAVAQLVAAAEEVSHLLGPAAHSHTCRSWPAWVSGRTEVGPCDCCYGRLHAAIEAYQKAVKP